MTNKKRIGLNAPIGLYKELKRITEFSGQTLNSLILQILWEWVEQDKFKLKSQ